MQLRKVILRIIFKNNSLFFAINVEVSNTIITIGVSFYKTVLVIEISSIL